MKTIPSAKIGKLDLEVTRLGLGGAALTGMVLADGLFGGVSRSDALATINAAFEAGIRYFDTAPLYGTGTSEIRIGDVLSSLPRDSFVISTKAGRLLEKIAGSSLTEDGIPPMHAFFDMKNIRKSLEESLKRLQLDYVDILLLHDPDVENLECAASVHALPEMVKMREEGLVKAIGVGMNQWEMPLRFLRNFELDVVLLAGRYTLLDQSALHEFLPLCQTRSVSVVIGGPYNSGILARTGSSSGGGGSYDYQPASGDLIARVAEIRDVCSAYDTPLRAASLQFVLAHPAVASVVPGCQNTEEVRDNLAMLNSSIPQDMWQELKAKNLLPPNAPTPAA